MKLLLDMNLPIRWLSYLEDSSAVDESVHWSQVGNIRAPDVEILDYARENEFIVFTHDLDFSVMLALTNASGPSVIQIRTQDVRPENVAEIALVAISRFEKELIRGALVTVNEKTSRARILPISKR